ARIASAAMRWAPKSDHIDVAELVGEETDSSATSTPLPPEPTPDMAAAVLFTSGATGPAKGVRYLHRQLAAQRDALATTYDVTDDDRLVAAFAPFALYGPALGVPTAFTDCDVTKPGSLTAEKLNEACSELGATMAFASPSALANVVATATATATDASSGLAGIEQLRLVFSAGAPVPAETLHSVAELTPNASIRTPYGMTEALPVADIDLDGIDEAERDGDGRGVCVGPAIPGAEVRIVPLGFDALETLPESLTTGEMGEILVRSPWVSEGYLARWHTERLARPGDGWHRSGDVGHLDDAGRLWVEGRSVHVIDSAGGPVTPVPIERAVERVLAPKRLVTTGRVAAVGIGPAGCQQVVVVIEQTDGDAGLAGSELAANVRAVIDVDVAAVLISEQLPVDIRHNAKIDRSAVAAWASTLLS
ncbi:AMP-binding protein, partial [Ilumatobacter sp.]|uniref:AMP-binding protein n=1 Tax=Ilumatobacter sp. TaxID=1967498 RepID=UPI003C514CF3